MAHIPVQEASVHRSPMCHLCLALAMHHHVWHSTRAIHVIAVQVCRFELAPSPAMSASLSSHDRLCLIRKFVAAAGKALPPPPPPPPAAPIAPPASQVSPHSAGAQFSWCNSHALCPARCVHCCARQRQLNVSCGGVTTNAGCRSQGGRASLLGDIQRLRIPSEG